MRIFILTCFTLFLSMKAQTVFTPKGNPTPSLKNYSIPLTKMIDSLKVDKRHLTILVNKSAYQLSIMAGNQIVKSYPIVLGFNPKDDKLREGDGCTPEGIFKVKAKYPHRSWSKFIWFDYPNNDSRIKHKQAKAKDLIPASAGIGGDVGIHGVPKGADYAIDQRQNWTLGCVSLKNKDIDEIYEIVFVGMKVQILP